MTLPVDLAVLTTFLLAVVRATAWVVICPPFSSPSIPARVKVAIGVALGLAAAPHLDAAPVTSSWAFIAAVVEQALIGLALGFVVLLLFSAVQAAGALIDLSSGFSSGSLFDPFIGGLASPMARLYQLLAITLLFVGQGHLMLVGGFLRSFEVAPAGFRVERLGATLVHDISTFFASAVEIALPMLVALLATELILGLLGKAAPQLNVLVLGFAVKILVVLLLGGLALRTLPAAVNELVGQALRSMASLVGG